MAATPQLLLTPPSPRGWGHSVPTDTQTLQTEDSRVLKEKSHQAKQDSPQGLWAVPSLPFPSHRAIPVSPHLKKNGDPLSPGHPCGDRAGTWQSRSHSLGVKPAPARPQQASCCPRHGDKLPLEPPNLSAPAPHSPPDSPTPFSAPAQTSHPTNPPAGSNETTHLSVCHPGMAVASHSAPLLLPHTPPWDPPSTVGTGAGKRGHTDSGEGVQSPSLASCCGFPIPSAPLSCKENQPASPLRLALPWGELQAAPQPCPGC